MIKKLNDIITELTKAGVYQNGSNVDLNNASSVYFLGIGGIGMSAIARYFNSQGVSVSGYDRTETTLTRELVEEGIQVHYEDDITSIDQQAVLVVFTPAIPNDHKQYNWLIEHKYPVIKRSEVLGAIINAGFSICVAGTHGKTTTSSMIAHLLRDSGFGCNAFLGGISSNYHANFWLAPVGSAGADVFVAEADEYDRSFLRLNPDIAIITAMDPDHLDIYGTAENVEQAFVDFAGKLKPGGCLIAKSGMKRYKDLQGQDICSYSLTDSEANIHPANIRSKNGSYRFDVINEYWTLTDVELNMGGLHNIENVVAAIGVAKYLKIEDEKIKEAVRTFTGVKRRFEYIIKTDDLVFIDDYAHHPEELRALITGARSLFPVKKCTVIFQPHLYSRTRDLAEGFAEVLHIADEVILLPIYPARELPMPGVSSHMIRELMSTTQAQVLDKDEMLNRIKSSRQELLITAGAGDIDLVVEPLKQILMKG